MFYTDCKFSLKWNKEWAVDKAVGSYSKSPKEQLQWLKRLPYEIVYVNRVKSLPYQNLNFDLIMNQTDL